VRLTVQSDFGLSVEPSLRSAQAAAGEWARGNESTSKELLGRPLRAWQRETREALGLPGDALIVMTGHQSQIWHAGILAKWFVADSCATRLGGRAAQLVVDQDVNDPALVSYPTEREGMLALAALPMSPARRDGPTGLQPTLRPSAPLVPPTAEASDGLTRITHAVASAFGAASAAAQLVQANDAMLAPFVEPLPAVFATRMLATPLGGALLDAMRRDPTGVAIAYDAALADDPRVARPIDASRRELPLWRLEPGRRERVTVASGGGLPDGLLAPRAFLMTAFARLALCDLFVHGTGGQRYERVTESWIRRWLGVELAPMIVATATLRLPLDRYVGDAPLATIADLRRLRADPDADLGTISVLKRERLARIDSLPRRSASRRAEYRSLLTYLEDRRLAHALRLEEVVSLVATSSERSATAAIASSRTWPWPLHDSSRITALRDATRALH